MKPHKVYRKVFLGTSDGADLILRSGTEISLLNFGEDGRYEAYIVDGECEIPEYYQLEKTFKFKDSTKTWLKIYDDESLTQTFTGKEIRVYRAGERGCVIQIFE